MLEIDDIADVIASAIREATGPLLERIAVLEGRAPVVPERGADGADGRDGRDGIDGKDGLDGQDGKDGADGADGRDGRDVDDIEVVQYGATVEFAFTVGDVRSVFEVELPEGPAGKDGERGADGKDGKLAAVAPWMAGIAYEGDIRTFGGGTWQALRDTASEPGGDDWLCLAAPGAMGKDGAGFAIRGLFSDGAAYNALDVVALNGASFVAKYDNPGHCPGDGWQLLASKGSRGAQGEKGERGERGPAGPSIVSASVNDEGVLTLRNADGSSVQCDFYPVLAKIAFRGL